MPRNLQGYLRMSHSRNLRSMFENSFSNFITNSYETRVTMSFITIISICVRFIYFYFGLDDSLQRGQYFAINNIFLFYVEILRLIIENLKGIISS